MGSTAKKIFGWGAALIAGYLILTNYTGATKVEAAGGNAGVNLVRAFQGR